MNCVLTVHIIEVISAEDYLFTQIYLLENRGPGSLGDLPEVTQDRAELVSHLPIGYVFTQKGAHYVRVKMRK